MERLLSELQDPLKAHMAFRELICETQERIYAIVRRMVIDHQDCDDIIQNVYIKAFQNIHSFTGQSNLYTWLYRIAVNETLDFLRQKRHRIFIPFYKIEHGLENKLKADSFFEASEAETRLQKAILRLPEKQRLVFNMRYFEDLSYAQISEIINTGENALKASYHIAEKKVRQFLQGDLTI